MARRLGIILATTVVALLVMTDGAWACRCMNRLINRCGYSRSVLQRRLCNRLAVRRSPMPGCCQPAGGEMKPAEAPRRPRSLRRRQTAWMVALANTPELAEPNQRRRIQAWLESQPPLRSGVAGGTRPQQLMPRKAPPKSSRVDAAEAR